MDNRGKMRELTLGYEWETLLLNKYGLPSKSSEMKNFIVKVRSKNPHSRCGTDWIPGLKRALFEIRSGVLRNKREIRKRTKKLIETTLEFSKEEGFRFLPIGSFPPFGGAIGLHIHIGSWEKTKGLQELANRALPYLPSFAALSVNSPFWGMAPFRPPFGVKSYRLKHHAQEMSVPSYSKPALSHLSWERDITVKFLSHPTIEIRICDAPLSWLFVCEITAFISSFIVESKKYLEPIRKARFIEAIDNRLRAMRDGLQAKFLWKGKEREVTDILKEMIKIAQPTLKELGYENLPLIEKMIKKRQTQADFLFYLFQNYGGDIFDFTQYLAASLNYIDDPFNTYLAFAPTLEVKNLMDIDEYLLSMIGKRTRYGNLYRVLYQPTSEFERRIENLKKKKLISTQFDEEKGALFSRLFKTEDEKKN